MSVSRRLDSVFTPTHHDDENREETPPSWVHTHPEEVSYEAENEGFGRNSRRHETRGETQNVEAGRGLR